MIVLLNNGCADLLLSQVNYNEDGSVKSGFVENGSWYYEVKDGEELASDEWNIRNRWPARNLHIIDVPKGVKGDYNDIMVWAEEQYNRGLV